MKQLDHTRVAILTEHGFEESELTKPKKMLEKAGAKVEVVSPQSGKVKGWDKKDWGEKIDVDRELSAARAEEYDALVLPGGVMNPDILRSNPQAVSFVQQFLESGKPVAAICHGPQTLIETGLLKGRTMTSYPSLQTDLRNAGAHWVDQEVVVDGNLITSRRPDDIPAFTEKLIGMLQTGVRETSAVHPKEHIET